MPEKSFADLSRPLRELFEKGNAAYQRENWDYAIAIFNQVLQKEPAFFDCRKALRACQFKKAGVSTGFFKRFLGSAGNSPMLAKGQIVLRSHPLEALQIAEQILNGDPGSTSAHKLLAEAALEADLPETAVLSLEIARRQAPNDKELAVRLGVALSRAGHVAKAVNLYRELERSYPNDQTILQELKNVVANRTMAEGGYETLAGGEGSYRDILKNKAETVSLEQGQREVKTGDVADRLIQEHEAQLLKEPQNTKLLRTVAELYLQKNDFDRALEAYHRAFQFTPGDSSLERTITEVTGRKYDQSLSQIDPEAPDAAEQRTRIEAEKIAFQIASAKRQVEKYPNDLQLRFDLGELYFQTGKLSEAIQEFQKAQANPHLHTTALNHLGQCFSRRGMNDLAVRTFQNAIKDKTAFDEEKKELVYLLGCVLEKLGKKEDAIEQFKQVYEIDIGYRDVGAKVDAYYGGQ